MIPWRFALGLALLLGALATRFGAGSTTLTAPEPARWGASDQPGLLRRVAIHTQRGDTVPVQVAVADTPRAQEIGLAGRDRLDRSAGMFFVFDHADRYEFWMRGTTIPLSIAFIDETHQIIALQDMEPRADERHLPPAPVRFALEVNRGFFVTHHIQVGDTVSPPAAGP